MTIGIIDAYISPTTLKLNVLINRHGAPEPFVICEGFDPYEAEPIWDRGTYFKRFDQAYSEFQEMKANGA